MAVHVHPFKPRLTAPGTKRLKPKYDQTPSNGALKFKLRRYTEILERRYPVLLRQFAVRRGSGGAGAFKAGAYTRSLFSST